MVVALGLGLRLLDHCRMSDDQKGDALPPGTAVARPEPLRGYRIPTEAERDLVDRIKRAEVELGVIWRRVRELPEHDERCHALAKDEFQDGFMWLVRAVTRPADVFERAPEGLAS